MTDESQELIVISQDVIDAGREALVASHLFIDASSIEGGLDEALRIIFEAMLAKYGAL